MVLDSIARRNLELVETIRDRNKRGSLLGVLDKTSTSMGGRLIRRWIEKPLMDINDIQERLNGVKELKEDVIARGEIREVLKKVYDIERLTGKVAYGTANARDLIALKNSLLQLPELKKMIESSKSKIINDIYNQMDLMEVIY